MAAAMTGKVLGRRYLLDDAWLTPVKDLIMTAVDVATLLGNTVLWRGRRFRVTSGCEIQEEP